MFRKWIKLTFFSSLFLLNACAQVNKASNNIIVKIEEKKDATLNEVEIFPGKVKLIKLPINEKWKNIELSCDQKIMPIILDSQKKELSFFLSESYFSTRTNYKCIITTKDNDLIGKIDAINVKVTPFKYPEEEVLKVDNNKVELNKKDLKRALKERAILDKLYQKSSPTNYFTSSFIKPMESAITSYYGSARIYNKVKNSQHLGTDFRAAEGEIVPSSNDGKVVFADNLFFTGNTVIIDHGLNIFSVYAHLSKIKVKKNHIVKKGEILGWSGKTGRVSGPHLHWGVKISGEWIDGLELTTIAI